MVITSDFGLDIGLAASQTADLHQPPGGKNGLVLGKLDIPQGFPASVSFSIVDRRLKEGTYHCISPRCLRCKSRLRLR